MADFTPDGQLQSVWHVRVGATFKKSYVWKTGEPAVPVDLSGWTAVAHIRKSAKEPDPPILELTTTLGTNGQGITLGAAGEIDIVIDFGDAGTELLADYKKAVFDLELTDAGGTFRRNLIGGPVIVYSEVTQP